MRIALLGGLGLGGKLLLSLATVACLAPAVSVGVFLSLHHQQLAAESRLAAGRLTQALGIAFADPIAARDADALRGAVGRIDGVTAVSVLGPDLQIRLSTDPAAQGRRVASFEALCADCGIGTGTAPGTAFVQEDGGRKLLRAVMALAAPAGGFLVVDHDPAVLEQGSRRTAVLASLGAALITLVALVVTWLVLRRFVLRPVSHLRSAAQGIAAGSLEARVPAAAGSGGEMAALGNAFNLMAERLAASMAKLRERDAFLQGVIDAVPDGIRVIADDYTIIAANHNFARQVGRPLPEIIGQPCYAVSHGRSDPCATTVVVCPVAELAVGEGPVKCMHLHRRGEEEIAVEVVADRLAIEGAAAPRNHVVESIRAVSQEVEVSLGQRLSEIGQLATGVAHEIHNPLASVQFGLRALQDAIGHPDRYAELQHYIGLVSQDIQRCIEVTGRLMRLAETSSSRGTLIEPGAVATAIASLLRYEAESRGVALLVENRGNPRIIASESDVGMVLINLIQNAFHATPPGGRIEVSVDELPDGDVTVAVADSGTGIPAADLDRLFLPFWSQRADRSEGSGLGLPICKALVRKWQGNISVSSREGAGTTFRLVFPSPAKLLDAA